jgi:hypothetical protein
LITRLTLRKTNGLYYISEQEDFFHPEVLQTVVFLDDILISFPQDFAALLLPASAPFIRRGLTVGTVLSNLFVRGANMLGYWRPFLNDAYASSEVGLYDKED